MRKVKVYKGEHIEIFIPENFAEIGNEADISGECIDAALYFAEEFASHLKAPKDFLLDFKNDLKGKLLELTNK